MILFFNKNTMLKTQLLISIILFLVWLVKFRTSKSWDWKLVWGLIQVIAILIPMITLF